MNATYTSEVNWTSIHELATKVDRSRNGMNNYGNSSGIWDHFGGTYCQSRYEGRGLSGLVDLLRAVSGLSRQCWEDVHAASGRMENASKATDSDYMMVYRSECPRGTMTHRTHRGAAWRATRYNGAVVAVRVLVQSGIDARRARMMRQTRAAVATAEACHYLMEELATTGVCEYHPDSHICGVHNGRINLTGLRWLTGTYEADGGFPLNEIDSVFAV